MLCKWNVKVGFWGNCNVFMGTRAELKIQLSNHQVRLQTNIPNLLVASAVMWHYQSQQKNWPHFPHLTLLRFTFLQICVAFTDNFNSKNVKRRQIFRIYFLSCNLWSSDLQIPSRYLASKTKKDISIKFCGFLRMNELYNNGWIIPVIFISTMHAIGLWLWFDWDKFNLNLMNCIYLLSSCSYSFAPCCLSRGLREPNSLRNYW